MNVWFTSNDNDWEKPIIDYFKEKGWWENVVWTSKFNKDKTYFYTSHLFDMDFPAYEGMSDDIYSKIYKYLYVAIDMYSRNSPISQDTYDQKNIHDYLNIFNMVVNYYYVNFRKERIDMLIMNRAPHSGHDFVGYIVAKALGIKTLILEQTLFPNKFFYYWDNLDYGDFSTSLELFDYPEQNFEKKFEKDLFYMKRSRRTVRKVLSDIYRSKECYLFRELFSKRHNAQALYRYSLKSKFEKNRNRIVTENIDFDKNKYVYFGLHLQPEKTTSNWGGIYCDQVLALEHLSSILPETWKIYVKENPKQKYFMRGEWFYNRLSLIPNVMVVPNDTDTYKLLKNCQIAATVTGTLGWEAITGGKPVLVFGWGVWYKKFPGVFKFEKSLNLKDIAKTTVDIDEVNKSWNKLSKKMAEGIIYNKGGDKGYPAIVKGYSKEKNIEYIKKSLSKILVDVNKE